MLILDNERIYMEKLRAIVTEGGTVEPIDDVRAITNFSVGRFGHDLARELIASGVDVTELAPRSSVERLGENDGAKYENFTDTESLRDLMLDRAEVPDIILHSAAVSDYRASRRVDGKISSDSDSLTIELERTPKIISELRENYGSKAFITGFKLLSGVSEVELIGAAMKQLKDNRLNMVIANDARNLRDGRHPVIAVTAEGGAVPFEGRREDVARDLAKFILQRVNVQWFRSESISPTKIDADRRRFEQVVGLAHKMNLLTDESGNVSVNMGDGKLQVSPRGVNKKYLDVYDAISSRVDESGLVEYEGQVKPSIDTGVSGLLYNKYSELESIIHFHGGWGRMDAKTEFPYPCGVFEEADEITRSLDESGSTDVSVELVHHGFLLGLKNGDLERLNHEWLDVLNKYMTHLQEVGQFAGFMFSRGTKHTQPIFDGLSVVGVIYNSPIGVSVFLDEKARGRGVGATVINQIIKRQLPVTTVDDCKVRDYYKGHGFAEEYDASMDRYVLIPPKNALVREFGE